MPKKRNRKKKTKAAPVNSASTTIDDNVPVRVALVPASAALDTPPTPPPPPSNPFITIHKLSPEQAELATLLNDNGQQQLFTHWDNSNDSEAKSSQMDQLLALHKSSPLPGGLLTYASRARELLSAAKLSLNPLADYTPSVPTGETLSLSSPKFPSLEALGAPLLSKSISFVLVAGGLGERLGYNSIKVGLPTQLLTNTCYLEFYIQSILAMNPSAPLAIMVSDDTHDLTSSLLLENDNFGMASGQITLMKQNKVAAISDNDGRIALDESNPFRINSKPHGHGDVHSLLHSTGVAKKWVESGFSHTVFFQDTNGLGFHTLAATLGVCVKLDLIMNSVCAPRKGGQAIGAVTKLTNGKTNEQVSERSEASEP